MSTRAYAINVTERTITSFKLMAFRQQHTKNIRQDTNIYNSLTQRMQMIEQRTWVCWCFINLFRSIHRVIEMTVKQGWCYIRTLFYRASACILHERRILIWCERRGGIRSFKWLGSFEQLVLLNRFFKNKDQNCSLFVFYVQSFAGSGTLTFAFVVYFICNIFYIA